MTARFASKVFRYSASSPFTVSSRMRPRTFRRSSLKRSPSEYRRAPKSLSMSHLTSSVSLRTKASRARRAVRSKRLSSPSKSFTPATISRSPR